MCYCCQLEFLEEAENLVANLSNQRSPKPKETTNMSSQAGGSPENEENQSDVTAAVPTGAQVSGINSGFKYLTSLRGHQNEIVVAKFSPCGTFLATGGEDKLVRIWCLTDGTMHKELYGNNSGVNDIAWHEDINKLATGGDDHSVKIWDLQLVIMMMKWKHTDCAVC